MKLRFLAICAGVALLLPGPTVALAGGCAGGAPALTDQLLAPGPGDPAFHVLVKDTATDHPKGAAEFVQFVHAALCDVGTPTP